MALFSRVFSSWNGPALGYNLVGQKNTLRGVSFLLEKYWFSFPRKPCNSGCYLEKTELRSHCKKKSAHIKYDAYLKKLFHPPSLSALLSTHFSENAPLFTVMLYSKKNAFFGLQILESFFTTSLVLEITSPQQIPFVKKGNENHNC